MKPAALQGLCGGSRSLPRSVPHHAHSIAMTLHGNQCLFVGLRGRRALKGYGSQRQAVRTTTPRQILRRGRRVTAYLCQTTATGECCADATHTAERPGRPRIHPILRESRRESAARAHPVACRPMTTAPKRTMVARDVCGRAGAERIAFGRVAFTKCRHTHHGGGSSAEKIGQHCICVRRMAALTSQPLCRRSIRLN